MNNKETLHIKHEMNTNFHSKVNGNSFTPFTSAYNGNRTIPVNVGFKLGKCLDPGSGQQIPAIWIGAGAYHGIFIPET